MSFPTSFYTPEDYLDECVKFFEEYKYLFRYQNTDILLQNVLSRINIPSLDSINVFDEGFTLADVLNNDAYLYNLFVKLGKLDIPVETIEEREVEYDLHEHFDIPLSPKKRYEIFNLVKEIDCLCKESRCNLLVDFGCGLGYLDQLIYEITKNQVLGLDSNEKHLDGAEKRQRKYHINSSENVKYIKHTVNKDSHKKIPAYLDKYFPDHGQFCIVGLHSCADLTVDAMRIFLKMADAKSMILMSCCYHKLVMQDGKFKNFPLSNGLQGIFKKYKADNFIGVTFMRLAAHGYQDNKDLYKVVFMLLTRAVIQVYASRRGYTVKRNKRKAVSFNDINDFESYILQAANYGFTLIPKIDTSEVCEPLPLDDGSISFDLNELRAIWRSITVDLTFKKVGILLLLQARLQPLMENFILLDRLLYFKERGINNCVYKKVFAEKKSPRCLALIATK